MKLFTAMKTYTEQVTPLGSEEELYINELIDDKVREVHKLTDIYTDTANALEQLKSLGTHDVIDTDVHRITMEALCHQFGYPEDTEISIEGVGESMGKFASKIWEKIKAAWQTVRNWVRKLFGMTYLPTDAEIAAQEETIKKGMEDGSPIETDSDPDFENDGGEKTSEVDDILNEILETVTSEFSSIVDTEAMKLDKFEHEIVMSKIGSTGTKMGDFFFNTLDKVVDVGEIRINSLLGESRSSNRYIYKNKKKCTDIIAHAFFMRMAVNINKYSLTIIPPLAELDSHYSSRGNPDFEVFLVHPRKPNKAHLLRTISTEIEVKSYRPLGGYLGSCSFNVPKPVEDRLLVVPISNKYGTEVNSDINRWMTRCFEFISRIQEYTGKDHFGDPISMYEFGELMTNEMNFINSVRASVNEENKIRKALADEFSNPTMLNDIRKLKTTIFRK